MVAVGAKPDLKVFYKGNITLVEPISKAGRRWIKEHVSQEGYQPYWPTVLVEHRYLNDLLEGAESDGLVITLPTKQGEIVPSNVNLWDSFTKGFFPQD